jgi:hypothetical protein
VGYNLGTLPWPRPYQATERHLASTASPSAKLTFCPTEPTFALSEQVRVENQSVTDQSPLLNLTLHWQPRHAEIIETSSLTPFSGNQASQHSLRSGELGGTIHFHQDGRACRAVLIDLGLSLCTTSNTSRIMIMMTL